MKTSFRSFGIGLFLAGMCLALLQQFDVFPTDDKSAAYKKEIAVLEKQLADLQSTQPVENKIAEQTPETTETLTESVAEQLPAKATEKVNEKSAPADDIQTATIFVYEGMSLYEIGQQIEGEGIVLNGREVELYLARPEYSRSIQKGSFDLRSDMTIEEIAKILTGKN